MFKAAGTSTAVTESSPSAGGVLQAGAGASAGQHADTSVLPPIAIIGTVWLVLCRERQVEKNRFLMASQHSVQIATLATPMNRDILLSKVLSGVRLLDGLSRDEMSRLLGLMNHASYAAGHYIFREGDLGSTLFILVSGCAEVRKATGTSKEMPLAQLQPGDSFGEIALVRNYVRSASVLACQRCTVLTIDASRISEYPEIAVKLYLNIAHVLADRLVVANEMLFHFKTDGVQSARVLES